MLGAEVLWAWPSDAAWFAIITLGEPPHRSQAESSRSTASSCPFKAVADRTVLHSNATKDADVKASPSARYRLSLEEDPLGDDRRGPG